jgi:hypothetical protein
MPFSLFELADLPKNFRASENIQMHIQKSPSSVNPKTRLSSPPRGLLKWMQEKNRLTISSAECLIIPLSRIEKEET